MTGDARWQLARAELSPGVNAPAEARAVVEELGRSGALSAKEAATVSLLVSELVTNAIKHAQAPPDSGVVLTLSASGGRLRVEVLDAGSGLAGRPEDEEEEPADRYGWHIVHQAVSRWGVDELDELDGTRVWFEIDRATDSADAPSASATGAPPG